MEATDGIPCIVYICEYCFIFMLLESDVVIRYMNPRLDESLYCPETNKIMQLLWIISS